MSSAPAGAAEFLFGAFGTRLTALLAAISASADIAALAALAPQVRAAGHALLDLDDGADLATRVVAQLNDALTERVVELAAAGHRLPAAAWCWLSLGSEGRCEQTFVTDQDNGLLFCAAPGEADELRRLFLPFARDVNEALAACGFPLCPGGVMAGNPAWCLSLDEWSSRFIDWIHSPNPEALLNAGIFFDFRPVCGEVELATKLRARLLGMTAGSSLFLRLMTGNALAAKPPLGLFGDLAAEDGAGRIDLKKSGARIFVDAARILALGAGMSPVNTVDRLRAVAASGALSAADAAASAQAFAHVQRFRLDSQRRAALGGEPPGNCIEVAGLNAFQRQLLRAAFKQARQLQQHIKTSFAPEA